jgi:cell division protein FtsZ
MTINLQMPEIRELKPKITVFGVGGAGGNAVNNMIRAGLAGCEFVVANTDSQALSSSKSERRIQMGAAVTEGLGAGSQPEVGRAAAEEAIDEIVDHLNGSHMIFVTAGMGGGTGTGAAPIIARAAREQGILTVGVVTKPFQFEGVRRMRIADQGIGDLQDCVDTLIVIPNQNLFRIANEKTTFADAFAMADQVLYSGVACITDLMVKEGLINLDFADVRSVMREMGKAMMGTGEASGDHRATQAAEAAIANPLLDETSMRGAKGLLISITGGKDLTLFEVDEAATRIREEVDPDANIILGATFEETLEGVIRVSVVATGIENEAKAEAPAESRPAAMNLQHRPPAQPQAIPQTRPSAPQTVRPQAPAAPVAAAAEPQPEPEPQPQAAAQLQTRATPQAAPPAAPAQSAPAYQAPPAPAAGDPGITIQPFDPGPLHYAADEVDPEQAAPAEPEMPPAQEPYIPPPAEAPPPRIPRVEDFPPVAQRQMEARRGEAMPAEEDRGPLSLLRRLASVGLGRREEDSVGAPQAPQAPQAQRAQARPQPQPRPQPRTQPQAQQAAPRAEPRAQPRPAVQQLPPQPRAPAPPRQGHQQEPQLYRPAQGDLDPHGRPQPRDARLQDDELEIPAFLRRQAN